MVRVVLNELINFILPNACLCCNESIEAGAQFICKKCNDRLETYNEIHPWKAESIENGIIDNSLSAFWFRENTEIQALLHSMKYEKMKSVGKVLGAEIGKQVALLKGSMFDFIAPVPLHKARVRDRSYNQSEYIAIGTGRILKAPVLNDLLIRTRNTQTQTKLNKIQRKENVRDAFEINPKHKDMIIGKNIIVVDDVITTGATVLECAKVLKDSGASNIWVCSAAYAALESG